jgi:hypothetical protein
MIMINSIRLLLLVFIFVGISSIVIAQSETSEIKRLSKDADVILTGKVSQKESSWNDSKTRIYTKTTVQVDEILKGNNSESSIEITTPGGEVGEVGELYSHMPTFEDNEDVLVFLKKDTKNEGYKVLHGEAGKIKVIRDTKSKEKVTGSNMRLKDLKSQIKSYITEK